ncbi:hypothetical protein MXB_4660 [Myxobolus squamalis]|nr:hypothetical protein MXB_4660 [Myxobolus squamalis]
MKDPYIRKNKYNTGNSSNLGTFDRSSMYGYVKVRMFRFMLFVLLYNDYRYNTKPGIISASLFKISDKVKFPGPVSLIVYWMDTWL